MRLSTSNGLVGSGASVLLKSAPSESGYAPSVGSVASQSLQTLTRNCQDNVFPAQTDASLSLLRQTGLRRRGESPANRHREATVTATLLDSTH